MLNNKQKPAVSVEVQVPAEMEPLSCPLPNMSLWNMHPRVYLALDDNKTAVCPYCDTHYIVCDE